MSLPSALVITSLALLFANVVKVYISPKHKLLVALADTVIILYVGLFFWAVYNNV